MIIEGKVVPKPFFKPFKVYRSQRFEVFLHMRHSGCFNVFASVPEHGRVDFEVTEYCISILPEGGKVPNIVVADGAGLTQFHHRLVVFIHESRIRVIQEVDELWKGGEQLFFLLGNLVVELYSVRVQDGVAHLVPDTLLLWVSDEGVLDLVTVG